jgi:hypothetical protein
MPKAPGLIAWLIPILWFTPMVWFTSIVCFTSGAVLTAWLDRNLTYRTAQYITQGPTGRGYAPSKEINDIYGGNVWLAAPQFQAAGVAPLTIQRLLEWGSADASMAGRLHY